MRISHALTMLLFFGFLLAFPLQTSASYILPYPSYMPGNTLYKISRILDSFEQWWFWGNIASTKYHLKLADKYLIEAKTLFEYKQYQLGVNALKRSNIQISEIHRYLELAQQEGKDIQMLRHSSVNAMNAHIGILERLAGELPENFLWTPEKNIPEQLAISKLLHEAILIRKQALR